MFFFSHCPQYKNIQSFRKLKPTDRKWKGTTQFVLLRKTRFFPANVRLASFDDWCKKEQHLKTTQHICNLTLILTTTKNAREVEMRASVVFPDHNVASLCFA